MENENTFGSYLKQKRQEKNLTQKELAKQLFVSESAISKWEKDVAHPDITLISKLAMILEVTEHELITASTDVKSREEKSEARKWRIFSKSWTMFFYIAYFITLIPCFICNLAVNKTLSWFWIVLFSLVLSFTFTNLPKLIKKHKLIILPASTYAALIILLGVCSIYTNGNWFAIPAVAILFGLVVIFTPIYISKYKIFEKIKKYKDFISIAIDFVMLNLLLITIDLFCVINKYSSTHWYFSLGFPIALSCFLILNLLMSVRFLKTNKLIKTSLILYFFNLIYLIIPFIKTSSKSLTQELNDINIFNADFSKWIIDSTIEPNIHLIIFLCLFVTATLLFIFGLAKHFKRKKNTEN